MLTGTPCPVTDAFGRRVTYLRLSVTDRCDLRCVYCMSEDMTFLPRRQVLSFDELDRLAGAFIRAGVRKIRLTGGEPLVRKGILDFVRSLSGALADGSLHELTLTTNGTRLSHHVEDLARAGVGRINVSLDTLDPERFRTLSRGGSLSAVLDGIAAAQGAGLAVKLNAVALRGVTEHEIDDLIRFAHARDMGLTLIETMPLGDVGVDRVDHYLPLDALRAQIERRWSLADLPLRTGGPARYVRVAETGGTLGFITPMTHNFCTDCNRVRVTASGVLHTCLGQEDSVDLRAVLRNGDAADLQDAIAGAIRAKPRGHAFAIGQGISTPSIVRHMSATGG